jgi:predicted amidohydrolase YtcJ
MAPEQKLSVYDAMKGITISAARTLDLEQRIGSIRAGKEATFTILGQNPFRIDPAQLKEIAVDGTVYKGRYWQNTAAVSHAQD